MAKSAESVQEREIVLTRLIDASPEEVYDAFTDPATIGQWWGPDGFTTTTKKMDVRVGGQWIYTMHGPDGTDYPNAMIYLELDRPRRIVYDQGTSPDDIWFRSTITFAERDGKTHVTLRSLFATAEARNRVVEEFGAIEGGEQHLGRLAAHLARRKWN